VVAVKRYLGGATTPRRTILPLMDEIASLSGPADLINDLLIQILLASHGYDMGALIHSASGSTMDPSSEFRPVAQLAGIFADHPHYGFVRNMVERGMDYVFTTELDEGKRILEMEANISRGDHKSAVRLLD
jgi:hypothetical protein